MTKYSYILIFAVYLLIWGCAENQEPPLATPQFEISKIRLDEAWNLKNTDPYTVEVHVQTSGSTSELLPVVLEVSDGMGSVLYTDSLYDDGAAYHPDDGDVIAGDGVFRNRFRADQITDQPVMLTFSFQASDIKNEQSAVYSTDIRFDNNYKPVVVAITAPDTLKEGTEAAYLYAAVFDKDGTEEVNKVLVEVFEASDDASVDTFSLFNDGNFIENGDVTAGDSIFSYKMDSSYAVGKKGAYRFRFTPYDDFTFPGEPRSVNIFLVNNPGQVFTVNMPDSLPLPAQGSSVLVQVYADVGDPQGLSDVDSVYFTLEDSQGEYVVDDYGNLVKITLSDDGDMENSGDQVAGDGIFSVIIRVSSTNRKESYTLHFYERDLVGNLSDDTRQPFVIY